MKRIIAMIRPVMLNDVVFALHQVEDFPGASITDIRGIGRGMRHHLKENREKPSFGYPKAVRIEIICPGAMTRAIVDTIYTHAHTGKPGDGKVFVSPVESALRISSGQTGEEAL